MGLGYMGVLTYGMQFVDSGKTSVLVYTMPIFVTVISHFKLNEKINVYKMLGLFSGLIGLLFILGAGFCMLIKTSYLESFAF